MSDRGKRRVLLGLVVGIVIAAALIVCAALNVWRFDGTVGPGCDWGSRYCDAGDYRYLCARYDGSTLDARWQTYCRGRR